MNEQERRIVEDSEREARHTMGVIVWIAVAFTFVLCGALTWWVLSLPWGVR